MYSKIFLLGNVGADPEVKTLESGVKTAKIRVATSESFKKKDSDEWEQRVEWHTVILWRNLADTADKYIRKGSRVFVEGTIHYRTYTDKNGAEKSAAEITASELKLLDKKETATSPEPSFTPPQYPTPQPSVAPQSAPMPAPTPTPAPPTEEAPDDLPF